MIYRIKKVKVYPREPIDWNQGVYLGMSMNNQVFQSKEMVSEVIKAIADRTNRCLVLVGDYLHRYNEQIYKGVSEIDAINHSMTLGQLLTKFFSESSENSNTKFEFKHTDTFVKTPQFGNRLKRFSQKYYSNTRFRELIDYAIQVFLRRNKEIKIPLDKAEKLCRNYLLEELAIFEILAEEGYMVNIYPGNQLPVIKEIVSGYLPDVSPSLQKIQAVEIKFRPQ